MKKMSSGNQRPSGGNMPPCAVEFQHTAVKTEARSHCVAWWWMRVGRDKGQREEDGGGQREDEVLRPEARIPIRRFRPMWPVHRASPH